MRDTFIWELLLVAIIAIALLVSLGGCLAKPQPANNAPLMFYQAYNQADENHPSPFFLTIKEAQEYCNRMNMDTENKYQIGFIGR